MTWHFSTAFGYPGSKQYNSNRSPEISVRSTSEIPVRHMRVERDLQTLSQGLTVPLIKIYYKQNKKKTVKNG